MEVMGDKKKEDLEAETGVEGRKSVTAQFASYISHSRPQLLQICVQAKSRLVLDRLEGLRGGTGEAARRRGRTSWLERKWDKEQQAQELAAR